MAWAMAGGMFLLPFAIKRRRSAGRVGRFAGMMLLLLAATCVTLGLSGCASSNSGYFGQQEVNYTMTVTATSGSLSHTTTITLTVE